MADYSRWKQYGASELWSQHKPYSPSQPRRATFRRALDDYTLTAPDLTKAEWSSDFADYGSLSLDRNGPRSSRSGRRQGVSSRSYDDDEGDEADIPSSSGFLVHDPPLDGRYALHPAAVNVAADALPQSFMLTIDEDTLGGADTLHLDVCAWFPQLGERSIGRVDVPLPDAGGPSVRLKLSDPLDIELHWRAYGAPASPGKGEWEAEAEPVYPPYGGGDW